MPVTTGLAAIRDNVYSLIGGIVPALNSQTGFDSTMPGFMFVRDFAPGAGAVCFRKFDVLRHPQNGAEQPPLFDSSAIERTEWLLITVAYPVIPGVYGTSDKLDIERFMRSDAKQIHDKVFSPANYLAGQSIAYPYIDSPDRQLDNVWYQPIRVQVTYTEAMTL